MAEEGDRGINFSSGSPFSSFVPVAPAKVGDQVTLYNLSGGDRLAVPAMNFALNDYVWVTPDFDFAGFDFNILFDFLLIPFIWAANVLQVTGGDNYSIFYDGTPTFEEDALIGKYVHFLTGSQAGNYFLIVSNGNSVEQKDLPDLPIRWIEVHDDTDISFPMVDDNIDEYDASVGSGVATMELASEIITVNTSEVGPVWWPQHGNTPAGSDNTMSPSGRDGSWMFVYLGLLTPLHIGWQYKLEYRLNTTSGGSMSASPPGQGRIGFSVVDPTLPSGYNTGWVNDLGAAWLFEPIPDGEWHEYLIEPWREGILTLAITGNEYNDEPYLDPPYNAFIGTGDYDLYLSGAEFEIKNVRVFRYIPSPIMWRGVQVGDSFEIVDSIP